MIGIPNGVTMAFILPFRHRLREKKYQAACFDADEGRFALPFTVFDTGLKILVDIPPGHVMREPSAHMKEAPR